MNKDLFFNLFLARATSRHEAAITFEAAFAEIQQLGQRPEYQRGFAQFQRFMAVAVAYADAQAACFGPAWPIHNLLVDLAMDEAAGSREEHRRAMELINSEPRWATAFAEFKAWLSEYEQGVRALEITVFEADRCLGTISLTPEARLGALGGLIPGPYRLCLQTGWVIWEQRLTERDLLWARAFPGQSLDLAAATEEISSGMTREETLLGGDLVLRVYPGPEGGTIRIELRNSRVW